MKNELFQCLFLFALTPNFQLVKDVRFIQELSNNPVVRQTTAKKGCKPLKSPVDALGNSRGVLFSHPKELAKQRLDYKYINTITGNIYRSYGQV